MTMKTIIDLVGILLVFFGVISFGYQELTYKKQEKVAEIKTEVGNFKLTADKKQQKAAIPPAVSGLSVLAGIVLVLANRVGRRK